jgi:hypothetical protein
MGMACRVGAGDIAHHHERAAAKRILNGIRIRQGIGRVGAHDPDRLDPPIADRAEEVDGLQARTLRDARAAPEGLNQFAVAGVGDVEMRRQHVCQSTDLTPAHGIGLARERERPHAGASDAPGEQVTVDDGIDLVGADDGLVHTL